ncbi:Autophagy-related protein 22 [Komagataella phaffii CBS 7435]|uniref:Autophagy-related protein n=1 Tax=Komagataella phaffii (strain ATCC 76273 / CBS 7435 / CECT 11047 / NRRL Y-11430 / Wegner 21-1) TaxID=981350 RepID=F2QP74_KOMPC|nr:GQ67_02936T0 [Komagataella phaffii]AOA65719.1 GQ68_02311T0 [Komagataella phaffii GS115]CAH2446522.1 Autophagy-related protein 22 [Komagataella phaffii CBS 7435]CCA36816.1 Autophagy-related protein 22 [Komagataella phaffii CBS 7435]
MPLQSDQELLYREPEPETDYSLFEQPEEQPDTSKREIFGWCLYSWSSEPFIVSVVGTYVPLLLEQLARDNGVLNSDRTTPCNPKKNPATPEPLPPQQPSPDSTCVLPLFNGHYYVDTSSFALYTFSLSVLVQTLLVISLSGAADRGSHRKQILIIMGLLGSLFTISYIFINDTQYYTASTLAVLANSCYGVANVCGNAFLPLLTKFHPELKKIPENDRSYIDTKGLISSKISGKGAATGYVSALIMQLLTMSMIVHLRKKKPHEIHVESEDTIWPIQVAISMVGIWWFLFQLPLKWLLQSRPGPPLEFHLHGTSTIINHLHIVKSYTIFGWSTLKHALNQTKDLKDISIFLLGWFIISDSLTTINSAAILFARSQLEMSTLALSVIGILTMVSAILGATLIPNVIQPKFNISTKDMLLYIIIWAALIPCWGILGFFTEKIGLRSPVEMYALSAWYGFALGGLATVSRSLYGLLIPPGQESIFYSVFSVTDKGSSILGPLIVGLIIDKTHNIRYCFYFLFGLLILALPIINALDVSRGMEEAKDLAEESGTIAV